MTRTVLPLLVLIAACSSGRYGAAEKGENIEGSAPVTIHPDIDDKVSVVSHNHMRTNDGRLFVRLTLANEGKGDRSLLLQTSWLDESRVTIDQSNWRNIYLAGGTTTVYESSSLDTRPVGYSVAVRPASTDRR